MDDTTDSDHVSGPRDWSAAACRPAVPRRSVRVSSVCSVPVTGSTRSLARFSQVTRAHVVIIPQPCKAHLDRVQCNLVLIDTFLCSNSNFVLYRIFIHFKNRKTKNILNLNFQNVNWNI